MNKFAKRALAVVGAAVVGSTALLASAGPAAASATYNGACGDGYNVVERVDLSADRGSVFLTYNSSNSYHCVATVRTVAGGSTLMEAMIRRSGTTEWNIDSGDYTTYAGPVYVNAAGECVDWGGTIGTETQVRESADCG